MKAHCSTCLTSDPKRLYYGGFAEYDDEELEFPEDRTYSACCNDTICDGLEYSVRVLPNGQEVIGCSDVPCQRRVRACCVGTARELLGLR